MEPGIGTEANELSISLYPELPDTVGSAGYLEDRWDLSVQPTPPVSHRAGMPDSCNVIPMEEDLGPWEQSQICPESNLEDSVM